jgi:glycosyltransferase involved in cell wall biosynthesis
MRDVSVCITCYNEAEYIGCAIRSVLEQTAIDQIKEIIVVDDGSTDESEQRIRELATEDTRLVHFIQRNQGLPAARNAAMREATGKYIGFLDGDDFWEPRKVALQLAAFKRPDVGLVYSDYVDFHTDSAASRMLICVRRFSGQGHDLVRKFFVHDGPIVPSSVMIRREVFQGIGGFDVRYRIGEDTDYWIRVALGGFGFHHTPGGLVFKRRHQRNLTRDLERFASVFEEQTHCYAELHDFLKPLVGRRLSRRYAKIGQSLLASGRFGRASSYLTRALRYDLRNARAYAYMAALPLYAIGGPNALNGPKRVYHLIRSRAGVCDG